jgi:hypothetical protein
VELSVVGTSTPKQEPRSKVDQRGEDATPFDGAERLPRSRRVHLAANGRQLALLIDTNLPEGAEMGTFPTGELYGVTGRSLLLFALESDT